jgi:hypothetical protein
VFPPSSQALLQLIPTLRLTTTDGRDPAIFGSAHRTIPDQLMEILVSTLLLNTELFSDTLLHSTQLATWMADGAPESALGAEPTYHPWEGRYAFLNLWVPHHGTLQTGLASVHEQLKSALQSELPTRIVLVRPRHMTPRLPEYETIIAHVPEHIMVTAPHLPPTCPSAAACCLCRTTLEVVLLQNPLADTLDQIDWSTLVARLRGWSLSSKCAAVATHPAKGRPRAHRVPPTQRAPPSDLISWVNWFDASTPSWPALNASIAATIDPDLGKKLVETRGFDRLAGAMGIIPKHLPALLKWNSRNAGPRQPCSQTGLDSLILQLRGHLLWGLYRRYSHRNHLFTQWWLSEANDDYRYTVTGLQVDSANRANKRRRDKALVAIASSRKKRCLVTRDGWVEDLTNSKWSRLDTTYRRGLNLRHLKTKPVYCDESLAHATRDEAIRDSMARGRLPLFF